MTNKQMKKMENEIIKACNPDAAPLKMAIPESARARALNMAMLYMMCMASTKTKTVKFRHSKGQLYIYIKNEEA